MDDLMDVPLSKEEKHDRSLRALELAALSGFMESVGNTQLSCLRLCNTCREGVPVRRLRISHGVPPSILALVYTGWQQAETEDSSRVLPHRNVLKVRWTFVDNQRYGRLAEGDDTHESPRAEGWRMEARDIDCMAGDEIDLSKVQWPDGMMDISLCSFNRCIDAVEWPPGLERLWFGDRRIAYPRAFRIPDMFNMSLDRVTFPAGLREIFLGDRFNQPIEGVAWPGAFERLSLPSFNQSIQDVQWPPGLKALEFVSRSKICEWIDEDIDDGPFRDEEYDSPKEYYCFGNLRQVNGGFNQPLGTTLPASLETLWLSEDFHQPLDNVSWPSGMVTLGFAFDSSSRYPGSITWPSNLQHLCMTNKPEKGLSYPKDSEVTIVKEVGGGDTNFYNVERYDGDEDPNDFETDSDQYGDDYTGDNYYNEDIYAN